jgi:hypothetical protein
MPPLYGLPSLVWHRTHEVHHFLRFPTAWTDYRTRANLHECAYHKENL